MRNGSPSSLVHMISITVVCPSSICAAIASVSAAPTFVELVDSVACHHRDMPSFDTFADCLRAAGFRGEIESGPATAAVYGTDNSIYQTDPTGAVVPTSIDDLEVLARCNDQLEVPFSLTARGGGTGTNGQSLTNGIVVDTRRAMNRIVSIDPANRVAIVEPGVVLAELNDRLEPDGLFFAPHTSTATRCTIGGMVSTDAAGKGSLVHGRTNRHVLGIEGVLADGSRCTFEALDQASLTDVLRRIDRVGGVHQVVGDAVDGLRTDRFPDIPRGFTGYNLTDAVSSSGLDMTKIICGSEGTLALIGNITLRLTPLPTETHLAVVTYPTFDTAIREANRLKACRPTAIECLDERTISLADASPAWPALAKLIAVEGSAMLLLGFDGIDGIDELRTLVAQSSDEPELAVTSDPTTIAAVWKVRADAVGLLGRAVGGRRSVAFVEDCAVPPHRLEEFVVAFRALLDDHDLTYGMFGHADVGCIHVRPALDLFDPGHEALVRIVSDEAAALVERFGGVLWGEHGRGFRGEYVGLDDDLIRRMRLIKTAFDPRNVLNPGKLYAPLEGAPPITRIDEVPLRVHADRTVTATSRGEFASAFECNGNGICHHWGDDEMMCPSFKVTLDPRLSPKGRADLVRAWLAAPDDRRLADEVADSMRQCLSCGACTGRCPVQVDVPELKSRFLEHHHDHNTRRRLRTATLSRFEALLPLAQRTSRVTTQVQRFSGPLVRRTLGVVDLPTVPPGTLHERMAALDVQSVSAGADIGDANVIILPDAFTALLDPDVLSAAITVLRAIGDRPAIAPFEPSGKFDHVTGRRRRFAAAVKRQRAVIEQLSGHGAAMVVIEPAIALLGGHEYTAIDPDFPADQIDSLATYLATRLDRLPSARPAGTVQLFGHCSESSLAPQHMAMYQAMLEGVGHAVTIETTSCCGMAGLFGHEVEHQTMSADLFDLGWRSRLATSSADHRCASGYSCRSQAKRFGFTDLVHPVQLVAAALERRPVVS